MPVEWARMDYSVVSSSINHWSRRFEYPWTIKVGNFVKNEIVLDAAGGNGILQFMISNFGCHVINIDIDRKNFLSESKATLIQGDAKRLCFADNSFDKVICISVLEHIEEPIEVIKELWRVLKTNGRLVITMDVAEYSRYNHTIDSNIAQKILSFFNMEMPEEPSNILRMSFEEIKPQSHEPVEVVLKTLCFYMDK
jgi:ubiquinone/menaquinone biosynthesis C-methylase UbiE